MSTSRDHTDSHAYKLFESRLEKLCRESLYHRSRCTRSTKMPMSLSYEIKPISAVCRASACHRVISKAVAIFVLYYENKIKIQQNIEKKVVQSIVHNLLGSGTVNRYLLKATWNFELFVVVNIYTVDHLSYL